MTIQEKLDLYRSAVIAQGMVLDQVQPWLQVAALHGMTATEHQVQLAEHMRECVAKAFASEEED